MDDHTYMRTLQNYLDQMDYAFTSEIKAIIACQLLNQMKNPEYIDFLYRYPKIRQTILYKLPELKKEVTKHFISDEIKYTLIFLCDDLKQNLGICSAK